jgi:hypothetical protein
VVHHHLQLMLGSASDANDLNLETLKKALVMLLVLA